MNHQPFRVGRLIANIIGWRRILLAGTLSMISASSGRADVLALAGRPAIVDVEILSLQNGRLSYRLRTGRELNHAIDEVDYLQIREWRLFNVAEQQRRSKHLRQAISSYEKVLEQLTEAGKSKRSLTLERSTVQARGSSTSGSGSEVSNLRELDRLLLLRYRLLAAYDEEGRFDRAVATYLDLLEYAAQDQALVESLRPKNLPTANSTFLAAASELVQAAVDRHGPDAIGMSLAQWRSSWPDVQRAQQDASKTGPAAPSSATQPGDPEQKRRVMNALSEVRRLIEGKRFDEALKQLDHVQDMPGGAMSAELYHVRAQAFLGKSIGEGPQQARSDQRRAGLALMRVVVHFPAHPLAPACLYRAAKICSQHGQRDQTAALLSELVETYPSSMPWSQWARRDLSQIQTTGSMPAS